MRIAGDIAVDRRVPYLSESPRGGPWGESPNRAAFGPPGSPLPGTRVPLTVAAMIRRRAVLAVALAALLPVTPAFASHLEPTASVSVSDLGVAPGAPVPGSHRVRIDWSGSCGPNAPAQAHSSDDSSWSLLIRPKSASRRPAEVDGASPAQPTGSAEATVAPGRRVFARFVIGCNDAVQPPPGPNGEPAEPVTESARAQADSAESVYVAPRIVGFRVSRGTWCGARGHAVPKRDQKRGIGASDFQTLNWSLAFDPLSMLVRPSIPGILAEVRLRASGKGVRLRVGPAPGPLRAGFRAGTPVFQATIFSPRSGKLKLWAEIGGVKTNAIQVPIVGIPCVTNPRRYYGAQVMRRANPFVHD